MKELLSAKERINQLLGMLTGQEIAKVLLAQGYSIEESASAFKDLGYVAAIEPFTRDIKELHVSNRPIQAGLAAIIASSEPRTLPSVVWRK